MGKKRQELNLYVTQQDLAASHTLYMMGRHMEMTTYEYTFWNFPYDPPYLIYAGLQSFLELYDSMNFTNRINRILTTMGYNSEYCEFISVYFEELKNMTEIRSLKEGEVAMPRLPMIEIRGPASLVVLLESMLHHTIGRQSIVATRVRNYHYQLLKFYGTAHSFIENASRFVTSHSSVEYTKAAYIGGITHSTNVMANDKYLIPTVHIYNDISSDFAKTKLEVLKQHCTQFKTRAILNIDADVNGSKSYKWTVDAAKAHATETGHNIMALSIKNPKERDGSYNRVKKRTLKDGLQSMKIFLEKDIEPEDIQQLYNYKGKFRGFILGECLYRQVNQNLLMGSYNMVDKDSNPSSNRKKEDKLENVVPPGRKKVVYYYNDDEQIVSHCLFGINEEPENADKTHLLQGSTSLGFVGGYNFVEILQPIEKSRNPDIVRVREYSMKQFEKLPEVYKLGDMSSPPAMGVSPFLYQQMKIKEDEHESD